MSPPTPDGIPRPLADQIAELLWALGVRESFGICGREIVPLWSALLRSEITTRHARHENGAGFAAIGASLVSGRAVVLFVTTGPGLTNAITSLEAARAAGAKVILVSPLTPGGEAGKLGIQDTGLMGCWHPSLYAPGRLFDLVVTMESDEQLPTLAGQLAAGLAGPGAFMAHIAVPTTLQRVMTSVAPVPPAIRRPAPAPASAVADEIVTLLAEEPFLVWAGWGAREHAEALRELLDVTGAPAMCSPRGLGIFDTHRQFIGITGNGQHHTVVEEIARVRPARTLVVGTGMGEATSGWEPYFVSPKGFIHIDLNPAIFGRAYPQADTLAVQADIGEVLAAILARRDRLVRRTFTRVRPPRIPFADVRAPDAKIHPAKLMEAIQRVIVERTTMPVLADASSAFFWGAHHLEFPQPSRWLIEPRFGSMGYAGGAVIGAAAAAADGVALAICGDGAMHMQDEISTAVKYGIRAIFVVLDDEGLGVVRNGMRINGNLVHDADYPATDFAAVGRVKGAQGLQVTREEELDAALEAALAADGPFVIDVVVDPDAVAPIGARTKR